MGGKRKRGANESSGPGLVPPKRAKGDSDVPSAATKPNLEPAPFVEAPVADERRREAALYDLLGSEDEADRISAADCIFLSLLGEPGVPEPVLQRHLDRRLFRGLASGRNASRLGFSFVITEVLSQLFGQKSSPEDRYPSLTFDSVLALLVDKTQAVGNISGQEERDHYFGQLFGIECFVRSGVLFADASRWHAILDLLLKLGNKKIWLRSQCGWVLVQALEQMTSEDEVKDTLLKVEAASLAKTPEGAAAWLVALNRYPELSLEPWRNPLSSKYLGDLAAVLKESFKVSTLDSNEKAQGNGKQVGWSAQLHFVWDIILGRLVKGGTEADFDALNQFWSRAVDDSLFSRNATDGQKFKGFMVFQKMLHGLADRKARLDCLFSKNFMTCLINQAAKEDRYLHRAAVKALKTIESVVSVHPELLVPVLRNLLGKNGVYNFDQRTSSKTVDKLLQKIDRQNAEGALTIIRQPITSLKQQQKDDAKATLRLYADYLSKILNAFASDASAVAPSDARKDGTYGPVLQELSALAYSQPEGIPPEALTEQLRDHCRSRIESSLARLTRRTDDFKAFCCAVASIDPSSRTMTEEIKSAINNAISRMKKLLKSKPKKEDGKGLIQGLAMLHAVSIFQLYNENPDAMDVLDDLAQFNDRLKTGRADVQGEGSSELLVEILLSMVARPSSLMRQISQQVFDAFTGKISGQGLVLLTEPLGHGESTKGEKELFNTEEDGMDVDGSGSSDSDADADSDVEMDSYVEFVRLAGSGGGDSEEESEDEEESGDGEDKSDAADEAQAPQDLDELVGKILNSHRLDKDDDAIESCSDGDMSDSEMLALDEKLAEVFRQRTKSRPDSKKQKKDAKQSVVNFKHRILDLVEIYVRNEALNPFAFSLLVPLLRLMRTTSAKSLAKRACEVILNYQRGCKKARAAGREGDKEVAAAAVGDLLPLLLEVHAEAAKENSHAYAKAASAASLVVASAMFAVDREAIKQVAAVYAKTQSEWVLGEARLQNSFFADWNNWCQNHASQARA